LHPDNVGLDVNLIAAYGYFGGDFTMDGRSKYTAPDVDAIYVFNAVLGFPANTVFDVN